MSTTAIKPAFIKRIKGDDNLKLQLAEKHGVKITSIDRWLRESSVMLTTYDSLEILKAYFGILDAQDLLEEESICTGE